MRGTVPLPAVLLASLAIACASPVRVSFDERVDFARYRTWDWVPGVARSADSREAASYPLGRKLMRHVEEELSDRGLRRDRIGADLLVGARLRVERRLVAIPRTTAMQHLASLHDSPSFDVQSTEIELQLYEKGRLEIEMATSRDAARVWRGSLEREVRGEIEPHLDAWVAQLLEQFPPRTPSSVPRDRPAPRPTTPVARSLPGDTPSGSR